MENREWKQRQYATLCIFLDGSIYFFNTHESTDDNALITLDWLRGTWYYEQYIDLMYQEMYPWLVE